VKIAIITPYYKEPIEYLKKCHESVLAQEVTADHFFVSDGHPVRELLDWNIKHVSLPNAHSDNGNTPRGIGGALAISEGYDFISYLDADNWFHPNHLSSLVDLYEKTHSTVCASFRTIHALDGDELVGVQDGDEINLTHIDTSCYLIHSNAFGLNEIWLKMPKILSPMCDRIFFRGVLHHKHRIASTRMKTLAFRSQYVTHYRLANKEPPVNAKETGGEECAQYLLTIDGVIETVQRLGFYPVG